MPGTIVVEFLPPIPPGLDKDAFLRRLQSDIETATARLLAEGRAELAAQRHRPDRLTFAGILARCGRRLRIRANALEPLRQDMQIVIDDVERFERFHRFDHVVAVVAGSAVALAHDVQLPVGVSRPAYCGWPRSTT